MLSLGEVLRRFLWNFFRLENEHLNNCGQFRAVRDICIAPIPSQRPIKRATPGAQAWPTSDLAAGGRHVVDTPSRYRARGQLFGSKGSLDRATYMQSVATDGVKDALVVIDNCDSLTSEVEKRSSQSSFVEPVKFQLQDEC